MNQRPSGPWLPIFFALSAIWGSSFLFIKVADRGLSPTEVALARVAIGAAVLLAVQAIERSSLPRGRQVWGHLAFVALVGNVLPFSLIAYGERHISSVLAGIWNATTPLMTVLVAMIALSDERPTRQRTTGLGIGFLGVIVLLGPWNSVSSGALSGDLACLGAAALYGITFPYMRRYLSPLSVPATTLAGGQLLCASVMLAIVVPLLGSSPGHVSIAIVLSLLCLGALGTGLAYVLSYRLIALAGATTASTVTYVIPVFATVLGIAVLGEQLTWNEPLGAVVILSGVAVSQRLITPAGLLRRATRRRPAPGPVG